MHNTASNGPLSFSRRDFLKTTATAAAAAAVLPSVDRLGAAEQKLTLALVELHEALEAGRAG